MSKKEYKRCPRCGSKTVVASKTCSVCNLKFDRIENLSNKEAKKAIKNKEKEKEKVLYVTSRPQDVSKKKFYLLYILLGCFGAYNIYIGKYKKGYYSLISLSAFIVAFIIEEIILFNGINTDMLNYVLVAPLSTFAVFGILIWFIDLIAIFTKSFKYPGALTNEDYIKFMLKSKNANIYMKDVEIKTHKDGSLSKKACENVVKQESENKVEQTLDADTMQKRELKTKQSKSKKKKGKKNKK